MPENGKQVDKETCVYCAKCRVCAIFIGVQPLLAKWGDKPPVDPRNLFKICDERAPLLVEQNGGPEQGIIIEGLTT